MSVPTPRPVGKQPPAHAPNAALLIDFDNVTMGIRSDLQAELKRLMNSEIIRGKVSVQRAYADWRRYPQYIVPLSEASIDLIFAPAFGSNKKNATDIRLAIDALELVFTRPEIGTFILLSGDSDFSSLVIKLKEYGKYVIGVGIRESSSDLLIQNCDEYFSYNDLAGLTRVGDNEPEHRDPWELVVDAVLEMKKRADVMRSDRLKQVMQEMDPSFDEKNVGMSRFSKFVDEARRKGLIVATKLENGQYEIDLGSSAPGGDKALPPIPGGVEDRQSRERAERSAEDDRGEARGRRGRRGGRGRGPVVDAPPAEGALSLAEGFDLLKRILGQLGAVNGKQEGEDKVRELMTAAYGKPDEILTHRPRFGRFLRQAQDAKLIDVTKTPSGYEVSLRPEVAAAMPEPAAEEAPKKGRGRGKGRGVAADAELVKAPEEAEEEKAAAPTGSPRGILYRRGSKHGAKAAQIPLVGVVDLDEGEPAAKKPKARRPARGGAKRGGRGRKKGGPAGE
ncbi:MAG: NYN domain-containing protein [Gemmatimonadales bacterium]